MLYRFVAALFTMPTLCEPRIRVSVKVRTPFRLGTILAVILVAVSGMLLSLHVSFASGLQDTIVANGRKQISQPAGGPSDSLNRFKYMKMPTDDTLRIFIETRNEVAKPEPYVTMLKITEGGAMTFSRQSLSLPEKVITAQLKPNEWKALRQALDVKKFQAFKPASQIAIAIYKQSITVTKGNARNTIRFQMDPSETDITELENSIKEQIGENGKPLWKFIQLVRAVNARFRW
jgi:hypothetical protein